MKQRLWGIGLVALCLSMVSEAQTVRLVTKAIVLEPFKLEVACNKTTHLIFPFSIIGIDRGSAGILAQKAAGVENILRVKADRKNFDETNLSVITSDGKLYSFLVCYNENPASLNLSLDSAADAPSGESGRTGAPQLTNDAMLARYAQVALNAESNVRGLKQKAANVCLSLDGLYVKENVLFFRLQLQNQSALNYSIDQLRLYIRDKVQRKRTAVQEKEVAPLLVKGRPTLLRANDAQTMVLALPAFSLPHDKYIALEMSEKDGSRHFVLTVKGKAFLNARPLQ